MCDKSKIHSSSSKELLYSEYMDTTVTEHAVELLQTKKKTKPDMHFQRSSVMERVNKLLPLLEQSQNDLNKAESNIEIIEGDAFVEMEVALLKDLNGDIDNPVCMSGDEESCTDMIESSSSNIEETKDNESDCVSESDHISLSSEENDSSAELSGDECEKIPHEEQHISPIKEID